MIEPRTIFWTLGLAPKNLWNVLFKTTPERKSCSGTEKRGQWIWKLATKSTRALSVSLPSVRMTTESPLPASCRGTSRCQSRWCWMSFVSEGKTLLASLCCLHCIKWYLNRDEERVRFHICLVLSHCPVYAPPTHEGACFPPASRALSILKLWEYASLMWDFIFIF